MNRIVYPQLIFFLVMISFEGCMYEDMTHMSSEEILWLSPYKEGDMRLYKSPNKAFDTLFIELAEISNSRFPLYISESGVQKYKAGGIVNYIIFHHGQRIGGSLMASKENDSIFKLSFYLDRRFSYALQRKDTCNFITNGGFYSDCMIINDNNSYLSPPIENNIVKSFVWSKSRGLVYYQYEDGTIYQLYSHDL